MRPAVPFVCLLALGLPLVAQERQKKLDPDDMPTLLDKAGKEFSEKKLGPCMETLTKAMLVVRGAMRKALAAAMPEVENFEKETVDDSDQAAAAMGLTYGVNVPFEQSYHGKDGNGSLRIAVHDNSPTVKMIEMTINMAAMQKDAEVIKYGEHKGLFRKENDGDSLTMQIVLLGKHMIDISAQGIAEEKFFKIFSQAWVEKILNLLGA